MGEIGVPRSCDRIDGLTSAVRLGFPQARIPNLDFALALVAAGRGQELAVRAERHAPDLPLVTALPLVTVQQEKLAFGRRVPDLHRLGSVRGGQAPAVGAQRRAADTAIEFSEGSDLGEV